MLVATVVLASCGGGGGGTGAPPAPSGNTLTAPSNFRITLQKVNLTSNEISLSWSGSGSTYHVFGASTSGGGDKLSVDVTGQSYTWVAPREEAVYFVRVVATSGGNASPPSIELPVFTMDLRNAIDALFFGSGPMADQPEQSRFNPPASIWPDGTVVRIMVSAEAGDANRVLAQVFADDYAATVGGAVRATTEIVSDDFHNTPLSGLPAFSIGMRVLRVCTGTLVVACANFGPAPLGTNRAFVNLNGVGGGISVSHEMGHTYGLFHVHVNASARPELNFLMNPVLLTDRLSDPEKNAIIAARNGGIHAGTTRNEALAAGLVLPVTGQPSIFNRR